MVKKQKPEIYRARSNAAKWFAKYIRLRDCLDSGGVEGECITCGKPLPIEKLQCGHFLPGRRDPIAFDERNAAAQCYQDNVRKQGMWPEFELATIERWGEGITAYLKHAYHNPEKWTAEKYRHVSDYYRGQYKKLKGIVDNGGAGVV